MCVEALRLDEHAGDLGMTRFDPSLNFRDRALNVSLRRAPRPGRIKQRRRGLETSSNARAGADSTWRPGDH